jgi:phytanoyl-CoA hydroxylase
MGLTAEQYASWDERGFVILKGFAPPDQLEAMIERVNHLARQEAAGEERPDLYIAKEGVLDNPETPEEGLAKIFRLMRTEDVFRDFATDPRLLDLVGDLLGPDVDCFLSQFIFKHPGALGQPWHQDDYYFRMTPLPQIGVWLACTAATPENGPLWVVPGSHKEDIHDVVPDQRKGAGLGYVEIIDAAVDDKMIVLMEPGDLLLFHSHLRHKSTDNNSADKRAAMVYHYAVANTVGHRAFNQDWTEVLRDSAPVEASTVPVPIER